VLDEYLALKREREELESSEEYVGSVRRSIAMRFGRLLGYSDAALADRLG
jgi:hypothetical protein